MLAYHEHNESSQARVLVDMLEQGDSVALISDAGTPLVSDPGYRLVGLAHQHNIKVVPVPGACAAIAALSVAGLATDRFVFEGFPPAKQGARLKYFGALKNEERTIVFYISCHRIVETLNDMRQVFGDNRYATFAREITKAYETVRKATLGELYEWVNDDAQQRKGEVVLVVAGAEKEVIADHVLENMLTVLVEELPVKQAAKIASRLSGVNKNELYKTALKLKEES
jgi:16S rRNA (cytidine1402-2'-O)-methyltransferase